MSVLSLEQFLRMVLVMGVYSLVSLLRIPVSISLEMGFFTAHLPRNQDFFLAYPIFLWLVRFEAHHLHIWFQDVSSDLPKDCQDFHCLLCWMWLCNQQGYACELHFISRNTILSYFGFLCLPFLAEFMRLNEICHYYFIALFSLCTVFCKLIGSLVSKLLVILVYAASLSLLVCSLWGSKWLWWRLSQAFHCRLQHQRRSTQIY